MGWVMMSERDLNRVEVLAQIDDGQISVDTGANLLALTRRQVFRLLKRYRTDGPSAFRHQSRGRHPNNRYHDAQRRMILDIVREHYIDFGPTFAAEKLAEDHNFKLAPETLRQWMLAKAAPSQRSLWRTHPDRRLRPSLV